MRLNAWSLLGLLVALLLTACGGSGGSKSAASQVAFSSAASEVQSSTISITSSRASAQSSSLAGGSGLYGLAQRPTNTTCIAPAPVSRGSTATISWERAFPSLPNASPATSLVQAPDNNDYWYLLRQTGRVMRFANSASANSFTEVLNIESRIAAGGETGLLGIAFHPQFVQNRYLYLNYTARDSDANLETRIARFSMLPSGLIDPDSELILLRFKQPYANHNGGQIAFGGDGYLYIATGDGGSGGDPLQNGQNTQTLLGKILRIDVNSSTVERNYGIPADNPFATSGGAPEIYAYGLRNPWRFSFDSLTQELWVGDVGQNTWEEINLVERGGNYGWGDMEGDSCYSGRSNCSTQNKIRPLLALNQSSGICSIIGGFVYRGSRYPAAYGKYFFSDFCVNAIKAISRAGDGAIVVTDAGKGNGNLVSFAQDNQGELYALAQSGGGTQIVTLQVTGGEVQAGTMAAQLSATGCVEAANPHLAAPAMIPYAVHAKLWSDGADKQRYLALPDNTHITLVSDGDFLLPVGSVLMKHFKLNERLVETRLFTHSELGWQGFSYEWRADQSDADLLSDAKEKMIEGVAWQYPSPGQCLICHTQAANFSLGLETAQLNGTLQYSSGITANQLDSLAHIGLFSSVLTDAQKAQALAPLADSSASLAQRARSYLHSNCSNCHRPLGPTPVSLDLRFGSSLASSCDQPPSAGDLAIANARIIAPGEPARSVLLARMQRRDEAQMPPLASHLVDEQAVEVISSWIASLQNCN